MLNETDLTRVDLNLLVLFEKVLQTRHVGRAGDAMRLSPSAISHGLGRLRRLFNDPLFLRTPKGVAPTARALELSGPVTEILSRVRSVVAAAEPFDPSTSRRRFAVGAPDGVSAVLLTPLLTRLQQDAPGLQISVRQVLPAPAETSPARAWRNALGELEQRDLDAAILPVEVPAPRFHTRPLYVEDFVVAVRRGHPFAAEPTLQRYCAIDHVLVSMTGEATGFVDQVLADTGQSRRIALTVPNFMFALSVVGETEMATALPRRFAKLYGPRFDVVTVEPPVSFTQFQLHAVALEAAMRDLGVAWLLDVLEEMGR